MAGIQFPANDKGDRPGVPGVKSLVDSIDSVDSEFYMFGCKMFEQKQVFEPLNHQSSNHQSSSIKIHHPNLSKSWILVMFRSTTSFNKEVYSAMANSLGAKEVGFWKRAAEETIFFPNVTKMILEKHAGVM